MLALAWVALLALLFTFLAMLWDFLLTSMTSCDFTGSRSMLYYNSTRSAITYDAIGAGSDLFDWHVSTNSSFTFRFEDAYCFFLQFFNLVALYSALLVLLFFCLDLLSAQGVTSSCGNPTPGFLYLGVVLR